MRAVVLLADVGAAVVVPLEDDVFSAVVAELVGFAVAGCGRERGRGVAHFRRREKQRCSAENYCHWNRGSQHQVKS